jgi:predicted ATP-grasp superfamily ATP-dependent carboligase/protein-tyrosine-phosphatase
MRAEADAGVIVTDGDERSALAVTRSLGARGIAVFVGAEGRSSLSGVSRHCRATFRYPSPWTHPDAYAECVLEQARRFGARVVFPMTDIAVETLGEAVSRAAAPPVLPIPSLEQYRALSDKYALMTRAQRLGVPIPETVFVPDGDVEAALGRVRRWPVVVKPGASLARTGQGWQKTAVRYAHDADQLRTIYRESSHLQGPSLLQSRVTGEGQGVFALFNRGRPVALFAHRRLRERPPSGGVSVLRESIPLPEKAKDYALRILQDAGWHGVAMVEFKLDAESATPYLMEVNGRFWGSLQLAIDAGVDFPHMLLELATGAQVQVPAAPYRAGVRSRWWLGDLDHLLARLRKSDRELDLPPGSPSRARAIVDFLNPWGARSEVLRASDPLPGLLELGAYGAHLAGRVGGAAAARAAALRDRWRFVAGERGTQLPEQVSRVLVLCTGNICRSPFAAELLQARARDRGLRLEVRSAGLDTTPGYPAYPHALTEARAYGLDLARHETAPVTPDMLSWADVVLVMEPAHALRLRRTAPEVLPRTFLLGQFASGATATIRDPYGGTPEDFRRCYALIDDAVGGLVGRIAMHSAPQTVEYGRR